jgi:hypothetical protein
LRVVLPTSSIKVKDRTPWFNINSSLSEDDPLRNSIKDAHISAQSVAGIVMDEI